MSTHRATSGAPPPIHDAEFAFTWSDFRQIASIVHGEAGILLPESKVNLVYSRLAKRLRTIGLRSFRDYCALVASHEGVDERQRMIAAMTTNVTRFFRESHHFDHMARTALPPIIEKARRGAKIRLWSAACSSGEEPYSMALTLLNAMPDAARHDILILATDIDDAILDRARTGLYPAPRLADIPITLRAGNIEMQRSGTDAMFSISDPVRRLIRFRHLNLLKDWPITTDFDMIFCRNVMIYFDQSTQNTIWHRFARHMPPDGHLYIGHSERITPEDIPAFKLIAQTTYRRQSGAT